MFIRDRSLFLLIFFLRFLGLLVLLLCSCLVLYNDNSYILEKGTRDFPYFNILKEPENNYDYSFFRVWFLKNSSETT